MNESEKKDLINLCGKRIAAAVNSVGQLMDHPKDLAELHLMMIAALVEEAAAHISRCTLTEELKPVTKDEARIHIIMGLTSVLEIPCAPVTAEQAAKAGVKNFDEHHRKRTP